MSFTERKSRRRSSSSSKRNHNHPPPSSCSSSAATASVTVSSASNYAAANYNASYGSNYGSNHNYNQQSHSGSGSSGLSPNTNQSFQGLPQKFLSRGRSRSVSPFTAPRSSSVVPISKPLNHPSKANNRQRGPVPVQVSRTKPSDAKKELELVVGLGGGVLSALDEISATRKMLKQRKSIRIVRVDSERINKMLMVIDKYSAIVDVSIQHHPDITALVWAGVRLVIQVALNRFQSLESLQNAIQVIVMAMADCEFYERIYAVSVLASTPVALRPQDTTKEFHNDFDYALLHVYAAVSVFTVRAKLYFEQPSFTGAFKPFAVEFQPLLREIKIKEQFLRKLANKACMAGIQEVSTYLEAMEEYQNDIKMIMASLDKCFDGSSSSPTGDAHECISAVNQNLIDMKANDVQYDDAEERRAILNHLYSENTDRRHNEIKAQRKEGTGGWLLRDHRFDQWMQGMTQSSLLWAYGIAGAGKTFLSSIVIDHLLDCRSDANYGVAYFYFSYNEQESQGVENVLASLVKQLCDQLPKLPVHLKMLNKKLTVDERSATNEELYSALIETSSSFIQTFIILDALDECDQKNQRENLLPTFHRLGESGIRMFLTSRRYPDDIQDTCCDMPCLEIIAHEDDIRSYIYQRIDVNPRAKRMIPGGELEDEIITGLVNAAGGMFLFANLNFQHLCQQPTARHILRELKRFQKAQITEKPMDPTYDRIFESLHRQSENCAAMAFRALTWVSKANRILCVRELQIAVSLEADTSKLEEVDIPDETTLTEICAGLIVIDRTNDSVRFAHSTVQEYLNRKKIIPKNADSMLATACAVYLSFTEFRQGPVSDFAGRLNSHHFLDYAAQNLSFHLQSCAEILTNEVFLRFLECEGSIASYLQAADYRRWGNCNSLRQPLHIAAEIGHSEVSRILIDSGAEVSAVDMDMSTPLHLASLKGHEAVVRLLLENGAEVRTADKDHHTPLHLAANEGHRPVVRLLLENGAQVSSVDRNNQTPLHLAAWNGSEGVFKLLIEKGADISAVDDKMWTPLHSATVNGSEAVVRLLLEKDVELGAVDKKKRTLLHLAAMNKSATVARLLLEKEVEVSTGDEDMWTPLHLAAKNGHEAVVRLLLEYEADVSVVDEDMWTPLHVAAWYGYEEVVRLLLENGAEVSAADVDVWTPLHSAIINGSEAIVRLLLENSADLSAVDKENRTLLHLAAMNKSAAVARLLLEKGAEVSTVDEDMWTPLHVAAWYGNETIVRLLLEYGAEVSGVDEDLWTPLHLAAKKGHEAVVRLLLESGADVSAVDRNNQTALKIALNNNFRGVALMLIDKNADVSADRKSVV